MLNKPVIDVGIVGYGAYVPRFRLAGTEISRVWEGKPCAGAGEGEVRAGVGRGHGHHEH